MIKCETAAQIHTHTHTHTHTHIYIYIYINTEGVIDELSYKLRKNEQDEQDMQGTACKDSNIWTHWPAITYIYHFFSDTVCSLEDLPGAMDDMDG